MSRYHLVLEALRRAPPEPAGARRTGRLLPGSTRTARRIRRRAPRGHARGARLDVVVKPAGQFIGRGAAPFAVSMLVITVDSLCWVSTIVCARVAHRVLRACWARVLHHRKPALVVTQHQLQVQDVDGRTGGLTQRGHVLRGLAMPGIVDIESGHVPAVGGPVVVTVRVLGLHPAHVAAGRQRRLIPQREPALHLPDLILLGGEDVVREAAHRRVGGVRQRDRRHLHRLAVVHAHVLRESDVDGTGLGPGRRRPERKPREEPEREPERRWRRSAPSTSERGALTAAGPAAGCCAAVSASDSAEQPLPPVGRRRAADRTADLQVARELHAAGQLRRRAPPDSDWSGLHALAVHRHRVRRRAASGRTAAGCRGRTSPGWSSSSRRPRGRCSVVQPQRGDELADALVVGAVQLQLVAPRLQRDRGVEARVRRHQRVRLAVDLGLRASRPGRR